MTGIKSFWRNLNKSNLKEDEQQDIDDALGVAPVLDTAVLQLDIVPNDAFVVYCQQNPGVIDLNELLIDSPFVRQLHQNGIKMVVPLVSQGELVGTINLGPRLSEQAYSADDKKLLNDLATQAAPAVRVAQLARQQQAEARERERLAQELRVARLIQQTLLPKDLPSVPGYELAAHYQPAREVGGDFYDFMYFDDGKIGIIVGDVTDKGVPAALVMATTRTLLRAAAERLVAPGLVLERVNQLLYPDIPARMFVTCLYAILDTATGQTRFANAGHDLPYRRQRDGVDELRATGMPLGLMPDMNYEEREIRLEPGETILFHSDGLVEAHDPSREMFGFPRLQKLMATHPGGPDLLPFLLKELHEFTGPNWQQEDDVTLVILQRSRAKDGESNPNGQENEVFMGWKNLADFSIPSQPGNERQAMDEVAAIVQETGIPGDRLEQLKTAVAEATMNAMEHGNKFQADVPVRVSVLKSPTAIAVRISDQGNDHSKVDLEKPDLEAKLSGMQSPRGWGLFLIRNMVDEMNVNESESGHTIELIINFEEGDPHGKQETL